MDHLRRYSLRLLSSRQTLASQQRWSTSYPGGRMRRIRRVALGISGGVDSTVSAILLKRKGYEVVGVFMKNWDTTDEFGFCQSDKEAEETDSICKQLDIPFHVVSFVKEYWHEVFTDLLNEYQNGFTPNPDIQCNRFLKFGHFHNYCMNNLGCDAVATGHYARTSYGEDLELKPWNESEFYGRKRVKLLKAIDRIKDQTFFLSQVSQEPLRNAMFPVGGFTKDVVKKIAETSGFEKIARKKESMGICFIGKRKNGFADFIQDYIAPNPGPIVDIDTGRVVGSHQGVHLFTLGQRVGGIGGGFKLKQFVAVKDVENATVYVCSGSDHPALFTETFFTGTPHWIDSAPPELTDRQRGRVLECDFRFQNTQPLSGCVVTHSMTSTRSHMGISNYEYLDKSSLTVSTVEPQRAVTPGQFAVFYLGDECLGSARIERVGPSQYTMNKNNCRDRIRQELAQQEEQSKDNASYD